MAEDYAEYLSNEAASSNAAVHEFITTYNDSELEIHVFFEGEEDFTYYLPLIRSKSNGADVISYNCGGKWNVIEARDSIEGSYNVTALFFVDRDYDDLLGRQAPATPCLYITDGYSVENDLSGEAAVAVVLQDILALKKSDAERLAGDVARRSLAVLRKMRCLSAWILASKEGGCSPNLNNTNTLRGIVSTKPSGELELNASGFATFKKKVSSKSEPSHADHLRWFRSVRNLDDGQLIRGKYRAWVFCKAIHLALVDENSRRTQEKSPTIRIPDSITATRVVELLGGRMPYPQSLKSFLDSHIPKGAVAP